MGQKVIDFRAAWSITKDFPVLQVRLEGSDDLQTVPVKGADEFLALMAILTSGREVRRQTSEDHVVYQTMLKS